MPSTSTAYCTAERQFRSVVTTTFPTFRCTNTSPGSWPVIWFAGTRLSEQPIHRMCGRWIAERSEKNEGSCARTRSAQRRLFSRISRRSVITSLRDARRPAGPHCLADRACERPWRSAGLVRHAFAVAVTLERFFARRALARVFRSVTLRGRARLTAAFVAAAFFVG